LSKNTLEEKRESSVHKTLFHTMQCTHSKYKIFVLDHVSVCKVCLLEYLEKLHKVMVEIYFSLFLPKNKNKNE